MGGSNADVIVQARFRAEWHDRPSGGNGSVIGRRSNLAAQGGGFRRRHFETGAGQPQCSQVRHMRCTKSPTDVNGQAHSWGETHQQASATGEIIGAERLAGPKGSSLDDRRIFGPSAIGGAAIPEGSDHSQPAVKKLNGISNGEPPPSVARAIGKTRPPRGDLSIGWVEGIGGGAHPLIIPRCSPPKVMPAPKFTGRHLYPMNLRLESLSLTTHVTHKKHYPAEGEPPRSHVTMIAIYRASGSTLPRGGRPHRTINAGLEDLISSMAVVRARRGRRTSGGGAGSHLTDGRSQRDGREFPPCAAVLQ